METGEPAPGRRQHQAKPEMWRRVLRVVLLSLAWSPLPLFAPSSLPVPLNGLEPAGESAPGYSLSQAERRAWDEIVARYQ